MNPTAALPTLLSLALLAGLTVAQAQPAATISTTSTGVAPGPSHVEEVCAQSKNKALCLSSLNADPNTKGADLSALTLISIRIAVANATDTATYIKGLLNDTDLAPGVQQALSDCSDNYDDAAQQLGDSLAALTVRNYVDLRKWVQTAAMDAQSCSEQSSSVGPDQLGLARRSKTFQEHCDIAVTIIDILEKNKQ